jgi:hypothetical protein
VNTSTPPTATSPAATPSGATPSSATPSGATGTSVAVGMPRPATVLRLVAGRGTFRLAIQLMSVALVAVWGGTAFSHYANALGLFAWLPLATATPEKAALKVLPRTRVLAPALARMTVGLSAAPVVVLMAALAPVAVLAPTSMATTYLAAAAWAACTGLLMTLAGLHRLRGRPALDTIAFGTSAAVVLAVTAVTWFTGWAPQFHLLALVAGTVAVTCWVLAALPRDWLRGPRPTRRLFPRLARTTALLGVTDIVDSLAASLIYAALAASGQITDSGPLYFALLASTMVCQLVFYLLRVAAPATSARLRGTGAGAGRARALELLRRGERLGAGFAVVLAVLVAVPATRAVLLGDGATLAVVLGALVLFEVGLFVMVMYASYLLENTDGRVLVLTSSAALVSLLAAGVLAVALVPPFGAVGGFAVLVLAITVKAHTLRRLLVRARPELATP